jgi:hypothetical protein
MTLTLNLPPALEASLIQQAAAQGIDVEAFVIETLRSKVEPHSKPDYQLKVSVEEFSRKLEEIAKMNPPVTSFVDVSRESIYD